MLTPLLTRGALARVLRSLMLGELGAARRRHGRASPSLARISASPWSDDLPLSEAGIGCDSLELLSLAAAVNEMFHLHEAGIERGMLSAQCFGDWLDAIEAAWRIGTDRITFTTSGSTGRPKRCIHGEAHLQREIDAFADRWPDLQRVVAAAPAHHIYGFLFTALLPDRLVVPCIAAEDLGTSLDPGGFRAGDLVVSFPERWAYLERSLPQWPESVEGVVSTAPCPPHLIADLRIKGLARMTEIYGSSETAGIAWRDSPHEPYRLMPQWRFVEPLYEAEPWLTHASGECWPMMDRVTRDGPDTFRLSGRRDDMVQVGGINVSPAAVEARLREYPGVRDAAVRLMRPEEGSRLKAFLASELDVNPHTLRDDVERWAMTHLPASERPASIAVGATLPTNVLGKAIDW